MSNTRLVVLVLMLALVGWLLYLLAPVLTPFVVAALLAYIGNPLVSRLERAHVPRVLGVLLVFVLFTLVFAGLVLYLLPLLRDSIASVAERAPTYYDWVVQRLARLETWLGVKLGFDTDTLRQNFSGDGKEIADWLSQAFGAATKSGLAVIGWLLNLFLIPVVTFYLLLDWEQTIARIGALIPPAYQSCARRLARETDAVLGSFLRGQLLVMLALATVYAIGLWIVGLELALPIGVLAGVVSFVPYLGVVVGLGAAGLSAYIQFQDVFVLVLVLLVFVVGQLLEGSLFTPRLVGRRIGLHPVAVIFAVMAGGQLFGFLGVLVALPVAAALKVWLRYAHEAWLRAPSRSPSRPRRR